MATDKFEPLRGLPLRRAQDAKIREYIARRQANGEAWDTLEISYTLKDMLDPPRPEDDAAGVRESIFA